MNLIIPQKILKINSSKLKHPQFILEIIAIFFFILEI